MLGILLMISNYFHDLAVALLASNILAVYYVGKFLDHHPVHDPIVGALFARLAKITYAALAYVLLAGAVRAWFFMDYEWNPAVGHGQIGALIVKHIVLVTVTVAGIILHRRYQKKYGIVR